VNSQSTTTTPFVDNRDDGGATTQKVPWPVVELLSPDLKPSYDAALSKRPR